jgi:hypothetical protein
LYNKYESLTGSGHKLSDEACQLIRPLVKRWVEAGFRARDIQTVIDSELQGIVAEVALRKAMDMRREEKRNIGDVFLGGYDGSTV